jgi:hypothetical protein
MEGNKFWSRGKFKKIVLTEYGRNYLIKHFPNTKNDLLMEKMDINFSSFHRIARSLGLVKTKQFVKKMQANATEAASKAWKALPEAERRKRIEIGVKNFEGHQERIWEDMKRRPLLKRLSPKKQKEVRARATAKRNATIASEKRRILFGLPQRTKMRLVSASTAKINARYRTINVYKWECNRAEVDFYETEKTKRNKSLEEKYMKLYGFRFHTIEPQPTLKPQEDKNSLIYAIVNKYMVD